MLVGTIDVLQDLKDAQETFKQNMPAAEEEFNSIMNLGKEVAELGKGVENPYTLITMDVRIHRLTFNCCRSSRF